MAILLIVYMVAGYWATGQTLYRNKIMFGTWNDIFMQRLLWGTLLGWILIPWAVIRHLSGR